MVSVSLLTDFAKERQKEKIKQRKEVLVNNGFDVNNPIVSSSGNGNLMIRNIKDGSHLVVDSSYRWNPFRWNCNNRGNISQ